MSRTRTIGSAAALIIVLGSLFSTGAAHASEAVDGDPLNNGPTVVIGGEVYGPEDGLVITTESYEMGSAGETVGREYAGPPEPGTVTPQAAWGSSYAYATEYAYITYRGVGKAAANIYDGQRIIGVCFWWSRGGAAVSGTTCSNAVATSSGWQSGPEAVGWGYDTLDSNAPPTIFNIQTTRVNPGV